MKEGKFFPLFVNLEGKDCLVIGAGKIAYRKAKTLLEYGAEVTVIGKEIKEKEFLNLKGIKILEREIHPQDINGRFLVCTATDNKELNIEIVNHCEEENILVNNMTSKTEMNCRFAAVIESEDYQIGISAKGNPKKSVEMKKNLIKMMEVKINE